MIIFEDADLEQAVKWGHVGIMHNMGQVCTATSRILVHESVYSQANAPSLDITSFLYSNV